MVTVLYRGTGRLPEGSSGFNVSSNATESIRYGEAPCSGSTRWKQTARRARGSYPELGSHVCYKRRSLPVTIPGTWARQPSVQDLTTDRRISSHCRRVARHPAPRCVCLRNPQAQEHGSSARLAMNVWEQTDGDKRHEGGHPPGMGTVVRSLPSDSVIPGLCSMARG